MLNMQLRQLPSASRRRCASSCLSRRLYSTSEPIKANIKLVAELRKRSEISMSKAREALIATNNDIEKAMEWVQKDMEISGAKKAEKVGGRETKEGLVAVSVLAPGYGYGTGGVRAAMIELNCETDFVGRNELFGRLVSDIAHSTAFHSETAPDFEDNPTLLRPFPVDALLDAPLVQKDPSLQSQSAPKSIGSAIRDTIAKVGENISLRRAVSAVLLPPPDAVQAGIRAASYVHGSTTDPSCGRLGALAFTYLKTPNLKEIFAEEAFRTDLEKLERALARQIVGFETRSIRLVSESPEMVLYEQPFVLYPGELSGQPVKSVLQTWAEQKGLVDTSADDYQGISVIEFARWSVGQDESSGSTSSTLANEMNTAESRSNRA